jgi:di/tricarboxylate transporter
MESATTRAGNASGGVDRPASRNVVRRLSTETKQAFKTTEFWAMVVVIVGILVAAASIKGGDTAPGTDEFIAKQAWLYVAIVAVGYMISRGLAKSGSREPYEAERDDDSARR